MPQRRKRLLALAPVAAATAAAAGVTLLVALERQRSKSIHILESVIIQRSPEDVYRFWRDFRNLPRFMEYLDSVAIIDDRRSHWRAHSGAEWDAEIVDEKPDAFISWRSLPGSDVENVGTVRFTAARRGLGTDVEVELTLSGKEPGRQVASDLRRLKRVLEMATNSSAAAPRGTSARLDSSPV
jgi:uncharacterized membrane protein